MHSFSCELFRKFEEILMKKFGKICSCLQYYLAKILDIIEVIDTTSIEKNNNTKKYSNLIQLREKLLKKI